MNDFDRLLELRLRQMLDPVVAQRPPIRRTAKGPADAFVVVATVAAELVPEAIPVQVIAAPSVRA